MDLVTRPQTKEPLPSRVTEAIFLGALRRGLLVDGVLLARAHQPAAGAHARREARDGVAILDEVFAEIARDGQYR